MAERDWKKKKSTGEEGQRQEECILTAFPLVAKRER